MQALFIAVAMMGLVYFLFVKRRFDFFSVAFFSACVYFLPGFFGFSNRPLINASGALRGSERVELIPETYLVFVTVMAAILLGAVAGDFIKTNQVVRLRLRGTRSSAGWAVTLALVGFLLTVASSGTTLLSANKPDVAASLDSWYTLWTMGASLGAVLAFSLRRWGLFSVSLVLLLANLYIGFRAPFANCAIALFVLWLSGKGRQRLFIQNWRIVLAGTSLAAFIFLYKQIYIAVKLGNWSSMANRLVGTDLYETAIFGSEPFTTQMVLNEVLSNRFSVGLDHLSGLVNLTVPFSGGLVGPVTSFNSLFQPVLFPEVRTGLANNIWAEMISSGGWPLFILFVTIFTSLLGLGSYLLKMQDKVVVGGVALFFAYWAFYIHRNDLLFQLTLERRVVVLWILCVLLAMFWYEARRYATSVKKAEMPSLPRKVSTIQERSEPN